MTISKRENLLRSLQHKECEFLPSIQDAKAMNVRIISDNIARGTVRDGREKLIPNPKGELDVFGVKWIFDPKARGSMEDPHEPHLLEDVENWEEIVVFPNPDEWDWNNEALLSKEYLDDTEHLLKFTIFTGFFERLISFMGFEEAAMALIDDDGQNSVYALFDRLCDLYIRYLSNMKKHFNIELVEIHDDWGGQASTFFSEDTLRSLILPHLKRFVDHAHSLDIFVELHSCGKIERFVPCMIDAGVDMWMGQDLNDKVQVFEQYGDKIVIEVELPELGEAATDEEIAVAAQNFVDTYIQLRKTPVISVYSYARINRPELLDLVFRLSSEKLASFGS